MKKEGCHNNFYDSPYHNLIESFIYANRLHRAVLEKHLNKTGVYRSQHQFLMYISRYPNASQKKIAERFHISTATVAVTLKKLEKGGYICRAVDEEDNRFNQIAITEKGQKVVDKSITYFRNTEQGMFRGFDETERNELESYLTRIKENLHQLLDETEREANYETLR